MVNLIACELYLKKSNASSILNAKLHTTYCVFTPSDLV